MLKEKVASLAMMGAGVSDSCTVARCKLTGKLPVHRLIYSVVLMALVKMPTSAYCIDKATAELILKA